MNSCPYPPGSFSDESRVYAAGPTLWTSQMFPLLEPFTANHRAFWLSMVPNVTLEIPGFLGRVRRVSLHDLIPQPREGLFVLLRDFSIVWKTDPQGAGDDGEWYHLVIAAGFITDVASIPLIVQLLFHMHSDGTVRPAALPHDLLYQLKKLMAKVPALFIWRRFKLPLLSSVPKGISRETLEEAFKSEWVHDTRPWTKSMMDKFFAKMMKAYGTPLNSLIYMGVHLGGGVAYMKDDDSRFYTAALYDVPYELRNSWPR
jgi:hypothetical protein